MGLCHRSHWRLSLFFHPFDSRLALRLALFGIGHIAAATAAAAASLQSCLTLCDPIDSSPPGSPVLGILHARTLEWVAISFSNAWKWRVKVKSLSHVWLLVTPWTTAYQAPASMGFSRQEYWSGVPLPSLIGHTNKCNGSRSLNSPWMLMLALSCCWSLRLHMKEAGLCCAKSSQSCLTLWDIMDFKPAGSSVHGILQARILEWVAMPSSRGSSWPRDKTHVSYVSCIGRWILYH